LLLLPPALLTIGATLLSLLFVLLLQQQTGLSASTASYTTSVQLELPLIHHHTTTVAVALALAVVTAALPEVAVGACYTIDIQTAASSASRDILGAVNEQYICSKV
jgi:hypothetical protein